MKTWTIRWNDLCGDNHAEEFNDLEKAIARVYDLTEEDTERTSLFLNGSYVASYCPSKRSYWV